jgi:hypothetical protein
MEPVTLLLSGIGGAALVGALWLFAPVLEFGR